MFRWGKSYSRFRKQFNYLDDLDFLYDVWDYYVYYSKQYKIYKIIQFFSCLDIKSFGFFTKLIDFFRWKIVDIFYKKIEGKKFNLYGVTIFCGKQGSGKTTSMVEMLNRIKKTYPDCIISSNFGYIFQDKNLEDWRDLLEIRNGEKGVVFAIDEIQNEFDNSKWQDFPEGILSVITQQRKQRIKILLTSQVYTRVVKQIREQCFEVVECKTFFGRWTIEKCYDADDYNYIIENPNPEKKFKIHKKWRYSFIQSNFLRDCFNSYAVVEKLKKTDFVKKERSR